MNDFFAIIVILIIFVMIMSFLSYLSLYNYNKKIPNKRKNNYYKNNMELNDYWLPSNWNIPSIKPPHQNINHAPYDKNKKHHNNNCPVGFLGCDKNSWSPIK